MSELLTILLRQVLAALVVGVLAAGDVPLAPPAIDTAAIETLRPDGHPDRRGRPAPDHPTGPPGAPGAR